MCVFEYGLAKLCYRCLLREHKERKKDKKKMKEKENKKESQMSHHSVMNQNILKISFYYIFVVFFYKQARQASKRA